MISIFNKNDVSNFYSLITLFDSFQNNTTVIYKNGRSIFPQLPILRWKKQSNVSIKCLQG